MVHSRGRLTPGVSFTPGVFPVLGDLPEMYPVLADLLPGIAVTRKDTCKLYLMFQANDKWKKFFYFLTQSMHKLKIPFLAAFFSTPVLMHGGLIRGCQKKTFREFSSDQPDYHSIWGCYDLKKFWLLKNDIFLYGITIENDAKLLKIS